MASRYTPLTIVIVDDYPDAADSLCRALSLQGHRCYGFICAASALNHLNILQPDVCILDIVMPGQTGYDLSETILKTLSYQPLLIAMSGLNEPLNHVCAKAAGFDRFMAKPVNISELLDYMGEHADSRKRTDQFPRGTAVDSAANQSIRE